MANSKLKRSPLMNFVVLCLSVWKVLGTNLSKANNLAWYSAIIVSLHSKVMNSIFFSSFIVIEK